MPRWGGASPIDARANCARKRSSRPARRISSSSESRARLPWTARKSKKFNASISARGSGNSIHPLNVFSQEASGFRQLVAMKPPAHSGNPAARNPATTRAAMAAK